MEKNILLCKWGLGDKLLTAISIITISKLTNTSYKIILNAYKNRNYKWGDSNYNIDLIDFKDLNIIDTINELKLNIPKWTELGKTNKTINAYRQKFVNSNIIDVNGPIPLSPIGIYELFNRQIEYYKICETYLNIAKCIQPSNLIKDNIPDNINECIGIHLRGTDKIINGQSTIWNSNVEEYNTQLNKTMKYIDHCIENNDKYFFISGDSKDKILDISKYINNKNGVIINCVYDDDLTYFREILDFFCLSKCKLIIQTIKASTYSLTASLIGNQKIINFSSEPSQQLLYYNLFEHVNVNNDTMLFNDIIKFYHEVLKTHNFSYVQYKNLINITNTSKYTVIVRDGIPIFPKDFDAMRRFRILQKSNIIKCKTYAVNLCDGDHCDDVISEDIPLFAFACKKECSKYTLIPDIHYLESNGYQNIKKDDIPWEQKQSIAYWRGQPSGFKVTAKEDLNLLPRIKLAYLSENLNLLDVKITNGIVNLKRDISKYLKTLSIYGEKKDFIENYKYKYVINIDGFGPAWSGLYLKLCSKCLVFCIESQFKQWYYEGLLPWVHYVPIKSDMSDLEDQVKWAINNDEKAKNIAEASYKFMKSLKQFNSS
uniref:Glycosyl transferase CAP10 domain-containing protein n=1 Tax=viral metagenome TaxID=1070528 RepID=A0A6C0F9K4_9ZZZZ|tara:strand:- start:20414 stop:22210 length:1797 start_codon:yes stop_codon:yes gene_type:complete